MKLFLPGNLVKSPTLGLGVVPSEDLQLTLDHIEGCIKNNEVRFICLNDGAMYVHVDNLLEHVDGKLLVKEM